MARSTLQEMLACARGSKSLQQRQQLEDKLLDPEGSAADTRSQAPLSSCKACASLAPAAMLLLCMVCSFGNYFCYDNPAALMEQFLQELCGGSSAKYLVLYSVYSMPNTITPFFGGYIIDHVIGLHRAPAFFCSLVALGSMVVALAAAVSAGASAPAFYLAVLGRFIFGLGGECNQVSINAMVSRWFKGRQLSTAFAISLSFSRFGSAANFAIMPILAASFGFVPALCFTVAICLLSFFAALALWLLDQKGEALDLVQVASQPESSRFDIGEVLRPREMLIYLICPFFYVSIQTFLSMAPRYFVAAWGLEPEASTQLCAIPFTVSALLSPMMGLLADRTGRPLYFVVFASGGLTLVHALASLGLLAPLPMVLCVGVLFSACAATLWPMVALTVESQHLATAYGVMTALQNSGLALAPLLVAGMQALEEGSLDSIQLTERIFTCTAFASFCCSLALLLLELLSDGPLLKAAAP